jgi:2,5-diketo-D-gluconate reductase B
MPPEQIPRLGLGTWQLTDPESCPRTVRRALETGYRHVDTAQAYGNESLVGDGLREPSVDRGDVFVATKINYPDLAYEDVLRSAERSRDRLGVDTLDLLYVHWPLDTYDPVETLDAFEQLVADGAVRHVGLSNFTPSLLEESLEGLDVPLLSHQVEMHPLYQQSTLHELAVEHGHWLVAYSPLAQGRVVDDSTLRDIAENYDATPAQVSLVWLLSKENVVAIPKARGDHVEENYAATDLELDPGDLRRIDDIDRTVRTTDHDWAPWNDASPP